ncbi:MAG: GT2 family glycosyltransferase [Halioglobus sp.]|jgi:GT2 family glycosyltransferase
MPKISVITVTYNPQAFLADFFTSLAAIDQKNIELEVIMVDNGSTDGAVQWVREHHPNVTVLENDENNYTRALNLGISQSSGEYVAIVNNDATVHEQWAQGFLEVFDQEEKIGAVQSKIFFAENDKLNSVGVEEVEHFYFKDIGFEEEDSVRYAKAAQRDYVTGGSVMFRRACLDDVGPWDEDFIMFMEDVDYSALCRAKGWQLWYSPNSILYHQYHGSTSQSLCEYFCTRNRFFFVAKHFPQELPACIPTSHFYKKGEYDLLYRTLLHSVRKMCECHDTKTVSKVLKGLKKALPGYLGEVSAHNFFTQLEVVLGLRKMRVGIYDHAGHFAGGGQRYVAEMAAIMQDDYDVTYIFNNEVKLSDYKEWFDLNLSGCSMKVIKIPFFEKRKRYTADEGMVIKENTNPFDIISKESLNYDIFINANMLGKVNPLSPASIFVCHFPDQERARFFQVDKYDYLVINGDYTGEWVNKRWQLQPTHKLYPPISMYNPDSAVDKKEKMILSVSRFEVSGSKKQMELITAFSAMCEEFPERTEGWKLVLMGGSTPDNVYFRQLEEAAESARCPIEIKANAPFGDIKDNYRRASIFWHACGLDETLPQRVEHFGMTTVEAMQNCCVPIVIDGGGQREIVVQGKSGYRFSSLQELQEFSFSIMDDEQKRLEMAGQAFERSHLFNQKVFKGRLESLLQEIDIALLGRDVLPTIQPAANDQQEGQPEADQDGA